MTDFDAAVLRFAGENGDYDKPTDCYSFNGRGTFSVLAFARAMCRYQAAKDAEICREADADCDGICQRAIEKAAGEL